jgi:uncharacterized protein YbbC (DUF1343 family)
LTLGCGAETDVAVSVPNSDLPPGVNGVAAVRPGIDVLLADSLHLVRGRRVGLITNHTGVGADGVSTIDRIFAHPDVQLVALFSPEHGIRGAVEAGMEVADETDPDTGIPIHSLYGETLKPTPEMLEGLDALLFDIQDVGSRYYTYIYTMALAMEAAGEAAVQFIVLDRPNPVGGRLVQGNVLDPELSSFVGRYPVPMRHGMTPGELASLFRNAFGVDVDLRIVPLQGWTRDMLYSDTGLDWLAPSPNMPELESALHYPGTCLFEGTNLSVGRGTDRAFQWIGAPWLDGDQLARILTDAQLPGVRFYPARFTPEAPGDGKFDGIEVNGIRLEVIDPNIYDPTRAAIALLIESRRMSGDRWEWTPEHFDRLAGTQRVRNGVELGESESDITREWGQDIEAFGELRDPVLIYR